MRKIFSLLFVIIFLTACEDVVDIETPQTPLRLSIDGLVRLNTDFEITKAQIKANLTSSFFNDLIPAEGAIISITNPDYIRNSQFDEQTLAFTEILPGVYEASKNTIFFSEGELELSIEYDCQIYSAISSFVPAQPITKLEQGDGTLFTGNETEVKIAFKDDGDEDNFYLVDLDFGDYIVTEDAFYQGQTFEFSYFYDDGIVPGQEINVSILGVDKPFYNYMNQIIVQAGGDQGPFQTPSATVRANIFNVTENITDNANNFALGYFAICQTYTETIIIE